MSRYGAAAGGDTPPAGTRSYCELLLDSAATAHLVGKPTLFFSHAWLYKFASAVDAWIQTHPPIYGALATSHKGKSRVTARPMVGVYYY